MRIAMIQTNTHANVRISFFLYISIGNMIFAKKILNNGCWLLFEALTYWLTNLHSELFNSKMTR